jgi:hypothetical protein
VRRDGAGVRLLTRNAYDCAPGPCGEGEANGRRHRSPRASDCASYNDSKEECYEATREAAMAAFGKSWRRG